MVCGITTHPVKILQNIWDEDLYIRKEESYMIANQRIKTKILLPHHGYSCKGNYKLEIMLLLNSDQS